MSSTAPVEHLVSLGMAEDYPQLPARIERGGATYFLTRDTDGWRLLSSVCPHLGGDVADCGDAFRCSHHGWAFDRTTGISTNAARQRMAAYHVEEQHGALYAHLPALRSTTLPAAARRRSEVTIDLHAHACLDIRHRGFSLLTDPWLDGPAFLGAWTQYPPPASDVLDQLRPDAIWISHEHSDHYHEPTLRHFDHATPVYFPDFPNRRLPVRLARLGFTELRPMAFGECVEIAEDVRLTCFEPASLWNDAILLIEAGGLRLLNLNDAGVNHRIASAVAPVDIVASAFTPGASGYPLTWTHLDDAQKSQILAGSRTGLLAMLDAAVRLYGADRVLPFAGHFSLGHPAHRHYVEQMQLNSVDDVRAHFADREHIEVIDLLPGEHYDTRRRAVTRRWTDRAALLDKPVLAEYLDARFNPAEFAAAHPADRELSRSSAEAYVLRLNQVPEMAFCEDLTVSLRATDTTFAHEHWRVDATVRHGRLTLNPDAHDDPELVIKVPKAVLAAVIAEDMSWDEAHIGYWCRFHRAVDTYHVGFWRLLQAPYYHRPAEPVAETIQLTPDSVIADVIERLGPAAERILRRNGLFCAGCAHSTAESLALGGRAHGLPEDRVSRLVSELAQLCPEPARK